MTKQRALACICIPLLSAGGISCGDDGQPADSADSAADDGDGGLPEWEDFDADAGADADADADADAEHEDATGDDATAETSDDGGEPPHGRGSCPAGIPLYATIVHMEPDRETRDFDALEALVAAAGAGSIPLTLQFTPSWGGLPPPRLATVHAWQAAGHEISVQHHGPNHRGTWDGYSNLSEADAIAMRETMHPGALHEAFLGDVAALAVALEPLSDGIPLRSATSTLPDPDWLPQWPYQSDGNVPEDAVSVPTPVTLAGVEVMRIGMGCLCRTDLDAPTRLPDLFDAAGDEDVFGVVFHANNYVHGSTASDAIGEEIDDWLDFLAGRDPDAACARTLSGLLDAW